MNIKEAYNLRLSDLTTNHLTESIKDYSQTKIKDLTLDDLEYLVRQNKWIAPLIRICIQRIEDQWDQIQVYYPDSELTEWFENVTKELILLPKRVWDVDFHSFQKICDLLKKNEKREIRLEKSILNDFLNYHPKRLIWDEKSFDFFESHIYSHHGEVLKAHKLIQDFTIFLNYGGKVKYMRNQNTIIISNFEGFKKTVLNEISEDNDEMMYWIDKEKTIKYS